MTYEQIKNEMLVGDYELAARMLRTSRDNIRIRFHRKRKDALDAIQTIIENRERLIREFQNKSQPEHKLSNNH